MRKADFVMMLKRFGHVEQMPNGSKQVKLNLDEIAGELEQLFLKHSVSRSAVAAVVLEAEKRVAKCIKDDIEFGYDTKMIKGKIKTGSYVGSSVETYRSYKRHFD